jgi:hypothetical protein
MHCPSNDIDLVSKSLPDCRLDQVTIVTGSQNNQLIDSLWNSISLVRLTQVVFYLASVRPYVAISMDHLGGKENQPLNAVR